METHKLARAINELIEDIDRVRLVIASHSSNAEEILQKLQRGMSLLRKDPIFEIELQRVRNQIRSLRRELEGVIEKAGQVHVFGAQPDGAATLAVRVQSAGTNLHNETSNLATTATQLYSKLNGTCYGVMGWNIKHDSV